MRFITKEIHAYLDYPVALALMILPYILGLGSSDTMAFYLSVVTGMAALILTILTDHQFGLYRIISYRGHLAVDALVGITFMIAPFIFGFQGVDAYYYWVNAAAVLTVVGLQNPTQIA